MKLRLFGLSLLLFASVPAMAQFDPEGLAARLKSGMTISQALLALGNRPTSALVTTCHLQTGEPFTCRVWNYTTQFEELQIYFRYSEPAQEWLVYSWRL
ncbi:MAG TPA: hypothetical protein VN808_21745 [Stellaceae bacterium]|nr:hypothetical protein [Stellaceae bacterium]